MRQSADFRFKLRAPKSLHLLESCTYVETVSRQRAVATLCTLKQQRTLTSDTHAV